MSLIKDFWEILQLINQYHKAQKEITEERNSLEEAANLFLEHTEAMTYTDYTSAVSLIEDCLIEPLGVGEDAVTITNITESAITAQLRYAIGSSQYNLTLTISRLQK